MNETNLKELVRKNRSYRRFYQEERIATAELRELVDLARLSASGANRQPLKYKLVNTPEQTQAVFSTLGWAGYLDQWEGPEEGERPAAYILILLDREIARGAAYDAGIAAQSILLGAVERGWGGCILASVERPALRGMIRLPERYEILLVLALGKPRERVQIETVGSDGNIQYWRDEEGVHHVPKRPLAEIILGGGSA
jgi:nitroreductase